MLAERLGERVEALRVPRTRRQPPRKARAERRGEQGGVLLRCARGARRLGRESDAEEIGGQVELSEAARLVQRLGEQRGALGVEQVVTQAERAEARAHGRNIHEHPACTNAELVAREVEGGERHDLARGR